MRAALRLVRILMLLTTIGNPIGGVLASSLAVTLLPGASVAHAAGLPDLQPVSLTIAPSSTMLLGQTYTATLTVRNIGAAPTSGGWAHELWLSNNPTYEAGDRFVASSLWAGGPVAPGATYTQQVTFTIQSIPPGTWYLLLRVDIDGALVEANETNNLLAIPVSIDYPPPPRPDLQPESITISTDPLVAGATAVVGFTVRNVGTQATNSAWYDVLYLSQDQIVSPDDVQLGGAVHAPVLFQPGDSYTRTWDITVPSVAEGTWYLIASADDQNALAEMGEANNRVPLPVQIVATAPPTPTATATPIPTDIPTASPTDTATPVPTDTATPVPTSTPTAVPTDTPTIAPTDTPTVVPTDTPTPLPTSTDTPIPTDTPTPVPTDTPTSVPTDTATPVPTDTPAASPTNTATPVPTDTPTPLPTSTPTSIPTDTPTVAPTSTFTPAPTSTSTATSTPLPTNTPTAVPTSTSTPTAAPVPPTATRVPPTATATFTATPVLGPLGGEPTATLTNTPPPATATATRTPVPPTATSTATATPSRTPVPPTATSTATWTATPTRTPVPPTATPTKTPTASTSAFRDGLMTGGGTLRDGDRTAALAVAVACDPARRPARFELIWRTPSDADPRDRDAHHSDWDWDDNQWNGRDWSTGDWKDRDWDDHAWDDRDWRNWGRSRSDNHGNGHDSDEKRGGWGRFHLTDITSVQCTNDPAVAPVWGGASFDTQRGTGRGRLADGSAATLEWTLVDGGPLGQRDRVTVKVRDSGGRVLFETTDTLSTGRLQARDR